MHGPVHALVAAVDHQKRNAGALQLVRRAAAYPAEAANQKVVLHLVDHTFFPALAKGVPEIQLDDSLRNGADRKKHGAHAEQDQE